MIALPLEGAGTRTGGGELKWSSIMGMSFIITWAECDIKSRHQCLSFMYSEFEKDQFQNQEKYYLVESSAGIQLFLWVSVFVSSRFLRFLLSVSSSSVEFRPAAFCLILEYPKTKSVENILLIFLLIVGAWKTIMPGAKTQANMSCVTDRK